MGPILHLPNSKPLQSIRGSQILENTFRVFPPTTYTTRVQIHMTSENVKGAS